MKLDFKKGQGLIPAVIQDKDSMQILMLGYMNEKAYEKTRETGRVTFFSRSKQRLWTKGETSGHHLLVESIKEDCDADTLLIKVKPLGPTCHLGTISCFDEDPPGIGFAGKLQKIIKDRKQNPKSGSYTSELFDAGVEKIAQKVGEEAVEVVIEALSGENENLRQESADLLYHLFVLWEQHDISFSDILDTLQSRHKP